jgi:tRNA(fMet)-specific endonuclease VapC
MIIRDTDHITVLRYADHPRCMALKERLEAAGDLVVTTVITREEQLRGWLAEINRLRNFGQQVPAYERLRALADFAADWEIVPFDPRAAQDADQLRRQNVRIGTQDLKIAAIARTHDALLLSANLRDFQKVPALRVENWLD